MNKNNLETILIKIFKKKGLNANHAKICSNALINAEQVGAYGHVMSSSYNSKSIASEIMVNKNKHNVIKKKIYPEDLLKFEKIAPWLKKN